MNPVSSHPPLPRIGATLLIAFIAALTSAVLLLPLLPVVGGAVDRGLGEHLRHVGVRATVDLAAFAEPALEPGLGAGRSPAA